MYYFYLYKSYRPDQTFAYELDPDIYPEDEEADIDEEDKLQDFKLEILKVRDIPHVQIFNKNSEILSKHETTLYNHGRILSL